MTTALVTGAYGAIGKAISRQLAERPGWEVVLVGRDARRAEAARDEIRHQTGNDDVRVEIADLSRRSQIQELAERWAGPLDVLINNASTTPRHRLETPDGLEMQFATNIMGYFWMIRAFEEILADSAPSRVVNVASYWAGGLDLDDLQFERRSYDNDAAYRQSKQAERMLTVAFAERLRPDNIAVNACHPGDVNSKLSNNLGFGGSQSPDQGAETPVWLATESVGQEETGKYFERRGEVPCKFAKDAESIERLFEICESYT